MADTKSIEEKALYYFKEFIVDSKVISQLIPENDKEPCWDGHLYVYSGGIRDKSHLMGRVPVQIKGKVVNDIITKKWKFRLEKNDLKAYLHEPTFFIVCQIKKDSKEKKLFYRELLPNRVKTLLTDMGPNNSRMTLFHPLPENLRDFEELISTFLGNSKKMISFADSKPMSMEDAIRSGIKEFSFIAPARISGNKELFKYLSTHNTYLYAKIDKEWDVDIPISDGPVKFVFGKHENGEIKIGDKVYFKGYKTQITDGRQIITIDDLITVDLPLDDTDRIKSTIKFTSKARYLKESIQEAEIVLALNHVGVLTIGDYDYQFKKNTSPMIEELSGKLALWKELDRVLDKMHVTMPCDLTIINQEQSALIDLLIETVGRGNKIAFKIDHPQPQLWEIGNVKLLLCCYPDKEGNCLIADFFDKSIGVLYEKENEGDVIVSPFSFLQDEHLWQIVDNIDYDRLIESAQEAASRDEYCYNKSNSDVLAMIKAADEVSGIDEGRCLRLLDAALKLCRWLKKNDPNQEMKQVHIINELQIIKRQRILSDEEKTVLYEMLENDETSDSFKFAIYLLMDNYLDADKIFESLPEKEKAILRDYPIWHFYNRQR